MTFDEIVTGVLDQGGFPAAISGEAGGWVNEVHKRVVAKALWMEEEVSLGNTVIDQAAYDVPVNVVDVAELWLEGDDTPGEWTRVSPRDLRSVRRGISYIRYGEGIFAPKFTSSGATQIELYPAPTIAGVPIMVTTAVIPATMTTGMSPVIPEDMHGDLMDGAIALGLQRRDERDASALTAKVDRMVVDLMRRKNSRIGSGPSRMAVFGVDFR